MSHDHSNHMMTGSGGHEHMDHSAHSMHATGGQAASSASAGEESGCNGGGMHGMHGMAVRKFENILDITFIKKTIHIYVCIFFFFFNRL